MPGSLRHRHIPAAERMPPAAKEQDRHILMESPDVGLGPVDQRAINPPAFCQRGALWFQAASTAMFDRGAIDCHPLRFMDGIEREGGAAETMILITRRDVFEATLTSA